MRNRKRALAALEAGATSPTDPYRAHQLAKGVPYQVGKIVNSIALRHGTDLRCWSLSVRNVRLDVMMVRPRKSTK